MTLFATLTKAGSSSSSSGSNNSCSPPEAIQLHGNKFIHFLSAKTVNLDDDRNNDAGNDFLKHFSALSYQAVQTQRDDVTAGGARRQNLRPDLGIWDCRIQPSSSASTDNTAMLLQRVIINKKGGNRNDTKGGDDHDDAKKEADSSADEITNNDDSMELPPTVVLTVDTTNPNSVQPSLEQMRNVLLSMMMNEETPSSNNNKLFSRESINISTSMKVLQSSPFGVTKITESVGSSLQESSSKRVAIIIAAIVASSSSSSSSNDGKTAADEFKDRQAKSLVLYHLHKFALECDCTLCFVRGGDDTNDDGGGLAEGIQNLNIGDVNESGEGSNDATATNGKKKSALSIDELGKVIRRVAMGLSPVEQQQDDDDDATNEGEAKTEDTAVVAASSSSGISAIHAPGSHDAELIHGAYLRNASCEGHWDASKDDLIVALPPQPSTGDTLQQQKEESKKGSSGGGDEEWLSKLAASVGLTPEVITSDAATTASSSSSTTPTGKKSPKRERPGAKKRMTRAASSKTKDGKPKDQKAVMNFFDDLLKK